MKANDLKNANELAASNNLTRCTQSVVRDSKRNQLIVTEEVSKGFDTQDYRKEISYFFFEDVNTSDVNPLLCEAKALATFRFLGIHDRPLTARVSPKKAPDSVEVESESAISPEVEEAAVEDTHEAAVVEKPKAKARKPRTTKVKPELTLKKFTEDEAGEEGDDALGLDDDSESEPEGQLYTKGKQEHAIHLRDLIVEKFGKDWKKDQKAILVAKKLVLKLDQRVHVVDDEGDVLESFKKEVRKMMDSL